MHRIAFLIPALFLVMSGMLSGQETTQPQPEQKKYVSPSARLAGAKTVLMKNNGGSEVPFNVFTSAVEGWGRLRLVESPEEADIVIEITSPDDERSSAAAKTRMSGSGGAGRMAEPAPTRSNYDGPIRVVVSDARTHLTLWSASEQPKGGFRQKARDEHMVESAQRLVTKFRERLEPPPAGEEKK